MMISCIATRIRRKESKAYYSSYVLSPSLPNMQCMREARFWSRLESNSMECFFSSFDAALIEEPASRPFISKPRYSFFKLLYPIRSTVFDVTWPHIRNPVCGNFPRSQFRSKGPIDSNYARNENINWCANAMTYTRHLANLQWPVASGQGLVVLQAG